MCDSHVHELSSEVYRIKGLTLTEKWKLLEAFVRDSQLTFGEELAKRMAIRRMNHDHFP